MKNINDEIKSLQNLIKFKKGLINNLSNKPEKTELIKIIQEEILVLERKVKILEETQKNGRYTKKPELGDERYKNFYYKEALDILRILYYDFFHKDPSISLTADSYMFGDSTLPISISSYLIRGEIPFKLMLTGNYPDCKPNDRCSVGINFDKRKLLKEIGAKYLTFMSTLIKNYSNNEINFICSDGINKNCILSYISDDAFFHHLLTNERMYYDFFDRLCDNSLRNIVYIGNTMKEKTRKEEIEQVDYEIVIPHRKIIAENLGVTVEEVMKDNEELKNQVLKLSI